MAAIHGRNGALYAAIASGGTAQPIALLNSWSFNRNTDRTEVTAFGDTNKQYLTGLPDAQGDYAGFYDDASAQLYTAASDGVARKMYLYPDRTNTGVYWFGTAFFDMSVSTRVDGAVEISGSWAAATPIAKVG